MPLWIFVSILNLTGYNFLFWSVMSLFRWGSETYYHRVRTSDEKRKSNIRLHEVAVVIAAHNEEIALPATLASLKGIMPSKNIYVGSDASSDQTVEICRRAKVNVIDQKQNQGKAKTIVHTLKAHDITRRYKAVVMLDADVIVDKHFLTNSLPLFNDPKVAAIAGHAVSRWHDHWIPARHMFFTAYRIRLWRILQYIVRYGQTWKYMNMTTIAPGGSSIYRSSALEQIEIDTPNLIIEDFNMTFTIHHKKLGRIAYHPSIFVIDQEPYTLPDYTRQVYRWHLGWWQTIIHHGIWPSLFSIATASFTLELIVYSAATLLYPGMFTIYIINGFEPIAIAGLPSISFRQLFAATILVDYFTTAIVGFIERKPVLSVYGLGFFLLRFIDSLTFLWAIPKALLTKSKGQWISPARRA